MTYFLSIDIDYWNDEGCDLYIGLTDFLEQVRSSMYNQSKLLNIVVNHEEMLDAVSASMSRRLINIDAHSDLADETCNFLCCGTWVTYVKWKSEGEYIWVRPNFAIWTGECNGDVPIFTEGKPKLSLTNWKSVHHCRTVQGLRNILKSLDDCSEVCICISPEYASIPVLEEFRHWLYNTNQKLYKKFGEVCLVGD